MGVRRVVTGHNDEGKAIFASDEIVEPTTLSLLPGAEFFQLWGADEIPTFPDEGSRPPHSTYFPPLGGYRFGIFTVQPDSEASMMPENFDIEAAIAEVEEKLPGMACAVLPLLLQGDLQKGRSMHVFAWRTSS